jgi:hypothetical protein
MTFDVVNFVDRAIVHAETAFHALVRVFQRLVFAHGSSTIIPLTSLLYRVLSPSQGEIKRD